MISVLIATHNRAALLEDCLRHLGRQRFEPGDEVIVVDNGSTDATSHVLNARALSFPVPAGHLARCARSGRGYAARCWRLAG